MRWQQKRANTMMQSMNGEVLNIKDTHVEWERERKRATRCWTRGSVIWWKSLLAAPLSRIHTIVIVTVVAAANYCQWWVRWRCQVLDTLKASNSVINRLVAPLVEKALSGIEIWWIFVYLCMHNMFVWVIHCARANARACVYSEVHMNTAKRSVCDCLVVSLALNRLLFFPHHHHQHHLPVLCVLCASRFVVFLNALQQHMSKLGRAKHTKTMMMWRYDDTKVSRLVRLPFFPSLTQCSCVFVCSHPHIQWRIIHGKYCRRGIRLYENCENIKNTSH